MAKKQKPYRGRFQAQGAGLEKSVCWGRNSSITKNEGYEYLEKLQQKLTPAELKAREDCFQRARVFVSRVPSNGIAAPVHHSFTPQPPQKSIRVDIEVNAGIAFVDKL